MRREAAILKSLLVLVLIAGLVTPTGCAKLQKLQQIAVQKGPLPAVSPEPKPKLPAWIEQISPTGEVETLAQIRVIFKNALIPVEGIESPDQQQKLQLFQITPNLSGHFRFLTPRMIGFQADQALPKATRVRVTLKAGLSDLKNNRLDEDLAWTFSTERIRLTNLPGSSESGDNGEDSAKPTGLTPTLRATSNVELDLGSLGRHTSLKSVPGGAEVAIKVELQKSATPPPEEQSTEKFDASARDWIYTFVPKHALDKATHYRLSFAPGIVPAQGNLPSAQSFAGDFRTYTPLAFERVAPAWQPDEAGPRGRFVDGSPQLRFNNGLTAESAQKSISITPAPNAGATLFQVSDGDDTIDLNPFALNPNTVYAITIGPGLTDVFGQTLDKPVSAAYQTRDVAADIWVPEGLNIFPSANNLNLDVTVTNLPAPRYRAAYRVVEPTELVYTDAASPRDNSFNLLPDVADWSAYSASITKNQPAREAVPLRKILGGPTGMIAYGITARTYKYPTNSGMAWREPRYYGLVQLTNLGVFAQWFPQSGLVSVHRLSDGNAVAGAAIEIYPSKLDANGFSPISPCATGLTDAAGVLRLGASQIAPCIATGSHADTSDGPGLLVIARLDKDWAYVRTDPYSGAYGYGIEAGWESGKPQSRGVIFSDRQLYQPGESGWFTAEAYYLKDGMLRQDRDAQYALTLEGPNGAKTSLGSRTTNEFGTFALRVAFARNQPLGYYVVHAKSARGAEISGEFRVAEFKPPNFKVELSLDKELASIGQSVEAKSQSSYLFGAPVEGGKANFYVTRQQTQFTPKGWDEFSFGRQWFWPEEPPSVPSDVLQTSTTLDAHGQASQSVSVANDLPYAMLYRVDMQTTDVSNLSVADSKTFTALPGDALIGLQNEFVADAGKGFAVKVIVTDPAGAPIEGRQVHLELQSMTYASATQVIEGGETARNAIEYKTVGEIDARSATQPQTVTLVAPKSGSYRIRANFAGAKDELTATDSEIWISGETTVNWGGENPDVLQVKLDKESYAPGDTATALIQSPYKQADLYFAVVRHDVIYRTITKVGGGAPRVRFEVTPAMLPNAAVQAVLVRRGPPLGQVEPGSVESLSRTGFAPFKVKLDAKRLKISIAPALHSLGPGARQSVKLHLSDAAGRPLRGQFTIVVANEAVLQLSGYRLPDLIDTVYAEQPISTRFADNRPNVVLKQAALRQPKGWGYGGGFLPGAAGTRIRKNFKALAYFNGALMTDANGDASVSFALPDDLTTWRVMAVAVGLAPTGGPAGASPATTSADPDYRFGNGDTTFITTKPLLTNPMLPQFARSGDRLNGGLSVLNNTGGQGTVSVSGLLSGPLTFDNGAACTGRDCSAQFPSQATMQAYRFAMNASGKGTAGVRFVTKLGAQSDAFEVPLELRSLTVTEQAVESGATTTQVTIPINVAPNVTAEGGLDVSISSTILPAISVPARHVLDFEELPFLEPAASNLAVTADLAILSKKYGQVLSGFDPQQRATLDLERLAKLQQADGGFAAWPGLTNCDILITPYAAQTLARARAGGLQVDSGMVARATAYLKVILANPGRYNYCKQEPCMSIVRLDALMALSDLGETRNDYLADIYDQRDRFDLVTRIKLARYLSKFSSWDAQAAALTDKIKQIIYITGRYATVNLPQGYWWFDSGTVAQAQALRLFIARGADAETLDRLVQSLLSQRRQGVWATTFDSAESLTALVAYLDMQPAPPNFTGTVQLAGKTLASATFQGYRIPSRDVRVPMANLPHNRNDLVLTKSGQGTLHYIVAYRYRLSGNQPGALNGLRVTREIRAANQENVIAQMGLAPPSEAPTLAAGQVFDVGLEIIADHPVDHVIITDPLPAGLEAVDAQFQTSTPYFQAKRDSWQIDYQTIYRDRVTAYANRLGPGVYSFHYLVRSVTPGTYDWPGSEAYLEYAPEEFGRTASTTLKISE